MKEDIFYVVSYGSNMLFSRIRERVKSVKKIKNIKLRGYRILFNKRSKDGSSKANLEKTNDLNDIVWCVLHEIKNSDKQILDKIEGLGYGYDLKPISTDNNIDSYAYICENAEFIDTDKPYAWYLDYVVAGAIENDFPIDYIKMLKEVETK